MNDRDIEARSRIVRVFPGYAGTVLWAWSGTVEYDESELSADLIAALREWEALGEREGLTGVPLPTDAQEAWAQESVRLARALAAELGSGFSVEMARGDESFLTTSEHPPTNMTAAEVFESRRVSAVAERLRWDAELAAMSPEERASLRYEPLKGRDLD